MHFEEGLCLECLEDLPRTRFHQDPDNRVEQLFRGKVQLAAASAFLHFSPTGMVQRMLHRLKYHHDRQLGQYLGRLMAEDLMISDRFKGVDRFLPVPLHPRRCWWTVCVSAGLCPALARAWSGSSEHLHRRAAAEWTDGSM